MVNDELLERIVSQLEHMTSLVGRLAFSEDHLKKMITKGSKKPDAMVKIYNLCTGEFTITEISRRVKIDQSSVTRAVNRWEDSGILHKLVRKGSVRPIGLYRLRE